MPDQDTTVTDEVSFDTERARAVSEVLGYSLIFGLIIMSIAIVTVGGLGSLEDARTNEQMANAERAFDVLHDNLESVHSDGAPSRSTEISLGDSQIFYGENITMRVRNSTHKVAEFDDIRPIIFRIDDDRTLVYEAGATIQDERQGGIVKNEPPFAFKDGGDGAVHVPIVRTTAPSVRSVGSTTVLVRGKVQEREVIRQDLQGGETIEEIELETPRYEIWENYFQQQKYCSDVDTNGDQVICDIDPAYSDRMYVTHQQIELELIT